MEGINQEKNNEDILIQETLGSKIEKSGIAVKEMFKNIEVKATDHVGKNPYFDNFANRGI